MSKKTYMMPLPEWYHHENKADPGTGEILIASEGVGTSSITVGDRELVASVVRVSYYLRRKWGYEGERCDSFYVVDATDVEWVEESGEADFAFVKVALQGCRLAHTANSGTLYERWFFVLDSAPVDSAPLSVSEAAERAGVHRSYIKAEIVCGNLPAEKIGNQWMIYEVDFTDWMNNPKRGSRST